VPVGAGVPLELPPLFPLSQPAATKHSSNASKANFFMVIHLSSFETTAADPPEPSPS
jgi:hypothetical protein